MTQKEKQYQELHKKWEVLNKQIVNLKQKENELFNRMKALAYEIGKPKGKDETENND